MHTHDGYAPHSHEVRADHGGVPQAAILDCDRANAALAELRKLYRLGVLGIADEAFAWLDRSLSAGGVLPEPWQDARRI